jgi:hypothetical protein
MIKRPTLVLLLLLGLIIIAYFLINKHSSLTTAEITPSAQSVVLLITDAEGSLQSLHIISSAGQFFQMQRDTSGSWIITSPVPGIADQSLAEAAVTQVGALRIISRIESQTNLKDYGLDTPTDTLEFTFINGLQRIFQVGPLTPTSSGYYLLNENGNVYIVGRSGIDALLNLLVAPPYASTETPIPTSEETVFPALQVSPNP